MLMINIAKIRSQFGRRRPINSKVFPQQNFQFASGPQLSHHDSEIFSNQLNGFLTIPQQPNISRESQTQMQQQLIQLITPRPVLTQQVRDCLNACPTTNEYNPVCGSDQISYGNVQKLECASRCGQNVQVTRQGRCALRDQIQN
ncbi:uncharacterized protein LOC129606000 isoform X2 [Condylostylus longicornis]|nr:uncharacterized protein LOC129606000 isoform X2 [Condylostylus longicornis]